MSLLFTPQAEDGESLSSLLTRAAHANGLVSIRPLLGAADRRSLPRDIDLRLGGEPLQAAADALRIAPDETSSMRLDAYVKVLNFGYAASGSHRWFLRSLKEGSPRFVVCPLCLEQRPHFRLAWRLAFMTDCPSHLVPMIEHCPHCGEAFHLGHFRAKALGACGRCGRFPASSTGVDRPSSTGIGSHDPASLEAFARRQGMGVAYAAQVFHGLYCIISLLNCPRFAKDLVRSADSVVARTAEMIVERGEHQSFESRKLDLRRRLFETGLHLLEGWPGPFVKIMSEAQILASKIKSNGVEIPYWLSRVIHGELHAPRRRVNVTDIDEAVAYLERKGGRLDKRSIARTLGIRESKVLDERFVAAPFDRNSARAFLRELECAVDKAPSARCVKATWVRDAAILTLACASKTKASEVCGLTTSQVARLLDPPSVSDDPGCELRNVARHYAHMYASRVRKRFLGRNVTSKFFLTRFGRQYEGHGLGQRCALLLRRSGHPRPDQGLATIARQRSPL